MSERIKLVRGDTLPQLRLVVANADTGEPIDITGAVVTMDFYRDNDILFTKTAIVMPAIDGLGVCIVYWSAGDLDLEAGPYEGRVKAVFPSGAIETIYRQLKFTIKDFGLLP